jgi:hypothetical protein
VGFTLVRALGPGEEGPFFIDIPPANLAVKLAVFSMMTWGLWRTLPHLPALVLLSPLDGGGGALLSVGTSTLRSGLELLMDLIFKQRRDPKLQLLCLLRYSEFDGLDYSSD